MIFSESLRLIFVKGRKVGGTSVEIALSVLCGADDIVTPITPRDEQLRLQAGGRPRNYSENPDAEEAYVKQVRESSGDVLAQTKPPPSLYGGHMPLAQVLSKFGASTEGFRIICVERSPYSKVLSLANFELGRSSYNRGGALASNLKALSAALPKMFRNGQHLVVRNIDLYRDLEGRIAVQPLRCEHLDADFAVLMRDMGIERPPALPHAKRGIEADAVDPRSVFTREQIEIINQAFAEEFLTFGYPMIQN